MFEKMEDQDFQKVVDQAGRKGRRPKWPFAKMEVCDIVIIKDGDFGTTSPQVYAHVYGRQSGKSFSTERVAPGTYKIVRVN
jgi:hypothetical protein